MASERGQSNLRRRARKAALPVSSRVKDVPPTWPMRGARGQRGPWPMRRGLEARPARDEGPAPADQHRGEAIRPSQQDSFLYT
jgi:hypothetical protein